MLYISIIYRVLKENLGESVEGKRENWIAQLKTNIKKENFILQQIKVLNSLC